MGEAAMATDERMTKSTKYRYVYMETERHGPNMGAKSAITWRNTVPWTARLIYQEAFGPKSKFKRFATEREAAMQVDKWLIELGRAPVNILKRKD